MSRKINENAPFLGPKGANFFEKFELNLFVGGIMGKNGNPRVIFLMGDFEIIGISDNFAIIWQGEKKKEKGEERENSGSEKRSGEQQRWQVAR